MTYSHTRTGRFVARPNRFVAVVEVDGADTVCHVKNTGRCKELLVPGCTVVLEAATNPERKTPYDVIAVYKGERLINMDSSAPNAAVAEWLPSYFLDATLIRPEYKWGGSRFDFYVETPTVQRLVEVKGVTLEENGIARFPDAPTERGKRHLNELAEAVQKGYEAYVVFVIQMAQVRHFEPNDRTHKAFGDALRAARKAGVQVLAFDTIVTPNSMEIGKPIPIKLEGV